MAAVATARALFGLGHDLTDEELLVLTASDTRPALKEFLAAHIAKIWRPFCYDQSLGLRVLIERAVGPTNLGNINRNITQERFPLKGTGVGKMKGRIEAYLGGETPEQAAKRLADAGHVLGNTGDLVGFLHDHPEEVAKWSWVDAISEDSRWLDPDGNVCVPYAVVSDASRRFRLVDFRDQRSSHSGVLVLSE